ncbi:MAG TPA: sugar phosphate isomerase/epimerase [Acidobacteriaceae bacterium]
MDVTRRRLLAGLAAASAASVCSPLLQKAVAEVTGPARLYPPMDLSLFDTPVHRGPWELRVGYAAITWGSNIDQAIEQISAAGYPGIQLLRNVLQVHPDPKTLEAALSAHKLTFVALSSGGTQLDPAKEKEMLEEHTQHAKYLQAAGGKYLQVIGADNPKGAAANWAAADYKRQGYLLTEIGKRAAEYGIQTGFHNHMNTIGQTPEATDAILDAADAKYVKLELDVAHYLQGGGDPAAAVRKYKRRLLFMHLKDTKPSPSARGGYEFVELGQGRVDFKGLLAALEETHFRGWGIVELDGERPGSTRTPEESARMSKQYLESLGVRV